jgi:hypothetical protein
MENTSRNTLPDGIVELLLSFKMGIHPTAALIKELKFEYHPHEDSGKIIIPATLEVSIGDLKHTFFMRQRNFMHKARFLNRHFMLSDFGSAGYDRYTVDSDELSGFPMGRVLE